VASYEEFLSTVAPLTVKITLKIDVKLNEHISQRPTACQWLSQCDISLSKYVTDVHQNHHGFGETTDCI